MRTSDWKGALGETSEQSLRYLEALPERSVMTPVTVGEPRSTDEAHADRAVATILRCAVEQP
ncbi:MAG: hypothetical protein ACXV3A_05215 [Kineosporiaceae bacterium]